MCKFVSQSRFEMGNSVMHKKIHQYYFFIAINTIKNNMKKLVRKKVHFIIWKKLDWSKQFRDQWNIGDGSYHFQYERIFVASHLWLAVKVLYQTVYVTLPKFHGNMFCIMKWWAHNSIHRHKVVWFQLCYPRESNYMRSKISVYGGGWRVKLVRWQQPNDREEMMNYGTFASRQVLWLHKISL